jgi:hypothetical protein
MMAAHKALETEVVLMNRLLFHFLLAVLLLCTGAFVACDGGNDNDTGGDVPDDDDDNNDDDHAGGSPFAAPTAGLSREDFQLLVGGGIDDRINSYPWAMSLFDGDGDGVDEIFVGTLGNALCLQLPFAAGLFAALPFLRPPSAWQCEDSSWDPHNWLPFYMDNLSGPVVFRGTFDAESDSWVWDRVFSPSLVESAGFRGSIVFSGALYMLGAGRGGGIVWKTVDGVTWEAASEPGVMTEHAGYNKLLRAAVEFDGRLYVASSSPTSSFIYASDDPAPGNWVAVNTNGFVASGGLVSEDIDTSGTSTGLNTARSLNDTRAPWIPFYYGGHVFQVRIVAGVGAGQQRTIVENTGNTLWVDSAWDEVPNRTSQYEIFRPDAPDNGPIYQMGVFDGRLFVGPFNYRTGAELWYADDPRPGGWTRAITGGYHNRDAEGFMTVLPFGDHLYLGTVVYPADFASLADLSGTEILRLDTEGNVELLVGGTRFPGTDHEIAPLSGMDGGFDYLPNVYSWNAVVHDGWLYWGTFDVAGLGGDFLEDWFPDGAPGDLDGFLDDLLGPDRDRWGGFDLWRTRDGAEWTPVSLNGFENVDNYGVRSFVSSPWGLVLGVANPYSGFELWLGEPSLSQTPSQDSHTR